MRSTAAILFSLVSIFSASTLQAQNLLTNPDFTGNTIAPWAWGDVVYDPQSASSDGSGSAAGTYTTTNGVMTAIAQCVTGVTPGSYYNLAGKVLIPAGQVEPGATSIVVSWNANTTCSNYISDDFSNALHVPGVATGVWTSLQAGGVAPAGAQSAWIQGLIYRSGFTTGSLQVKFDEMSFQLAPAGNFVLTVSRTGLGYGGVTGTNIDCGFNGNDCTESMAPNSMLTLTAVPSYISTFAGWTGGGCSGSAPTCTVTMDAAKTVSAQFDLAPTVPLHLTFSGGGSGSVAITNEDGGCDASCNLSIPQNAVITLAATAAPGSVFAGWSGACVGVGACTLTMNAAQSVTAQFAPESAGINSIPTLGEWGVVLLSVILMLFGMLGFRRRP